MSPFLRQLLLATCLSAASPAQQDPLTLKLVEYYDAVLMQQWSLSMTAKSCTVIQGSEADLVPPLQRLVHAAARGECIFDYEERISPPNCVGICRHAGDSGATATAICFDGAATLVVRPHIAEPTLQSAYRNGGALVWPHDALGFYAGMPLSGHIRNAIAKGAWEVHLQGASALGSIRNPIANLDPMTIRFDPTTGLPSELVYPPGSKSASTAVQMTDYFECAGLSIPRKVCLLMSAGIGTPGNVVLRIDYELSTRHTGITPEWLIRGVCQHGILNSSGQQWVSPAALQHLLDCDFAALSGVATPNTTLKEDWLAGMPIGEPTSGLALTEWPRLSEVLGKRLSASGCLDVSSSYCTQLALCMYLKSCGVACDPAQVLHDIPDPLVSAKDAASYLASKGVDCLVVRASPQDIARLRAAAISFTTDGSRWHASFMQPVSGDKPLWAVWEGPQQVKQGRWTLPEAVLLLSRNAYNEMVGGAVPWLLAIALIGVGLIAVLAYALRHRRIPGGMPGVTATTMALIAIFATSCSGNQAHDRQLAGLEVTASTIGITLGRGETKELAIPVQNKGSEPVTIYMKRTGCSCIQPTTERVTVDPGADSAYMITVADKDGKSDSLTVELVEEGTRALHTFTIAIQGWRRLWVTPASLTWRECIGRVIEGAFEVHVRTSGGSGEFSWDPMGHNTITLAATETRRVRDELVVRFLIQVPPKEGAYHQEVRCTYGIDDLRFSIGLMAIEE